MDKKGAQFAQIAALNDKLRRSGEGGQVVITRAVEDEGPAFVVAALRAVCDFDEFTPDNDPYLERDFGSVEVDGKTVVWKIDLYEDPSVKAAGGSPVVTRVLTIMLAEDGSSEGAAGQKRIVGVRNLTQGCDLKPMLARRALSGAYRFDEGGNKCLAVPAPFSVLE